MRRRTAQNRGGVNITVGNNVGNVAALASLYGAMWAILIVLGTGRRRPWWARALARGWERVRDRYRGEPPPPPPPILFALELRRLSADVQRVTATEEFSKAERVAVSQLAYDIALRDYCRSVDLPVPAGHGSLSRKQRFELETALITSGHDW